MHAPGTARGHPTATPWPPRSHASGGTAAPLGCPAHGGGAPHPSLSLHVPARAGLCPPAADGVGVAECLLPCLQDGDCPPSQKCCLQGCGRACPKPGECPVAQPGPCRERCRGDSDCPDVQKCCNSSCGRQDMICPHPSFHSSSAFRASDEHPRPQLRAAT
uniref:WAP domain-containing protein n=1 Tax=Otus sunia TaxID=257818 RepID=A0A8C8E552_9STRI